jgi:hypothetical protein
MTRCLRAFVALVLTVGVSGAASPVEIYRGHLIIAPETEVFRPCGSDKPLWLDYAPEMRALMLARYMELSARPYRETYVVLRGIPGPKLACAFCEYYPGSFKVLEVIEHRKDGPATCE